MTLRRPFILIALLTLTIAVVAAVRSDGDVQPARAAIPAADPLTPYLHVGGIARTTIVPDRAEFSASVSITGRTAASTSRSAAARIAAVTAKMKSLGVTAANLRTQSVFVFPRPRKGKPTVWSANVNLQVTTTAPNRVGELMGAALLAGATSVGGPQMSVADSRAAYELALAAAIDDARHKADTIAAKIGMTVVAATSIDDTGSPQQFAFQSEGQFSVATAAASTLISFPIEKGTVDVPATVDVVFSYGP